MFFDRDAGITSVQGFPDVERLSGGDLLDALSDAYSRYGEEEYRYDKLH